ncbi:MAG: UpxY family transcription antiterminator [Syntrophaceae bacterium]|nr:UpxY family transcription antiterminator [Syntrophaceae bacterium]
MPWYAIHTRSRHEDTVQLGLVQKAYRVFLPKMEVWSKRKDRRKKILIPLFPGYLFIELGPLNNEIKLDVLRTFGVVRLLGKSQNADPTPIPYERIDAIRRIVQSKVDVQQLQYPKVGDAARIIDGPFKGVEGMVLRTDYERELFVIEIELLQRSLAIKLEGFRITRL